MPREVIEAPPTDTYEPYKNFWSFLKRKQKPKQSRSELLKQNTLLVRDSKTNEYKTILTLLDDAERWRNVGDKELEKQVWKMIAEKASLYSDGMREKYTQKVQTRCGEYVPKETSQDDEDIIM